MCSMSIHYQQTLYPGCHLAGIVDHLEKEVSGKHFQGPDCDWPYKR